mgnify:CR=1 FL=1
MRRSRLFVSVIVLFVSSLSVLASEVGDLLSQADLLVDPQHGEFDFAGYEARLRGAIELYEQALPLLSADDPARQTTLHALARSYFELAEAYLPTGDDQESAYVAGKDYALEALRLDPEFVEREKASFRDALSHANDVAALLWYGNNQGLYLGYHMFEALLSGGTLDVPACYERAIELDETFLAGAPLRSLACFLAQAPGFFGGDMERSRELFERAIAIAPEYLENKTDLAEWVLKPAKDETFCAVLTEVYAQAADPAVMAAWPLYNALAITQADRLSADCP